MPVGRMASDRRPQFCTGSSELFSMQLSTKWRKLTQTVLSFSFKSSSVQKFSGEGAPSPDPSPDGKGDTPSPLPTPLVPHSISVSKGPSPQKSWNPVYTTALPMSKPANFLQYFCTIWWLSRSQFSKIVTPDLWLTFLLQIIATAHGWILFSHLAEGRSRN